MVYVLGRIGSTPVRCAGLFGVNCKFECDNVAVYEWYRINGIRGQSGEARGGRRVHLPQKFTRNIGGLDCTSVAYMTSPLCVGIDSHISARHVAKFGVDLEENASGDVAKIVKVGNEFGLVGEQICSVRSVEKIIRDVSDEIVLHEHLLREYATDLLLVVTTAPVSTWAFTTFRLASVNPVH
jgi:hypothetical protein